MSYRISSTSPPVNDLTQLLHDDATTTTRGSSVPNTPRQLSGQHSSIPYRVTRTSSVTRTTDPRTLNIDQATLGFHYHHLLTPDHTPNGATTPHFGNTFGNTSQNSSNSGNNNTLRDAAPGNTLRWGGITGNWGNSTVAGDAVLGQFPRSRRNEGRSRSGGRQLLHPALMGLQNAGIEETSSWEAGLTVVHGRRTDYDR